MIKLFFVGAGCFFIGIVFAMILGNPENQKEQVKSCQGLVEALDGVYIVERNNYEE